MTHRGFGKDGIGAVIEAINSKLGLVYFHILDKYDLSNELHSLTKEERTVVLIWFTIGIIENGGFEYLFEGDVPGDENYHYTLEAYHEICPKAYALFSEVFRAFPSGIPPKAIPERIATYNAIDESIRERYADRFFKLVDKIAWRLFWYTIRHRLIRFTEIFR